MFCQNLSKNIQYGVIEFSVANMCVNDDSSRELVSQALMGAIVEIEQVATWYYVKTIDGYQGWVHNLAVVLMTFDEIVAWQNSRKIIVENRCCTIYQEPAISSSPISDAVSGCMLQYLGEKDDFYQVKYPSGKIGYLLKENGIPEEIWRQNYTFTIPNFINYAKTFLGIPYVWGGTSCKGVDCSGLVSSALAMHDYIIPRDAWQQAEFCQNIDEHHDLDNLLAGDLLFFGKDKITHVAIYLGNGEYIHASGCVRINSLNSSAPNYEAKLAQSYQKAGRIPKQS